MIDFSIIVPAYNNLELLQNALSTIVNQKAIKFEIIIVDDSDNDIISDYIERLQLKNTMYFHNIPSLGAVKNWNFGLSMANGEFLILLHHDEYFIDKEYFLNNCYMKFKKTACDAIISNSIVYFTDGNSKRQIIQKYIKKLIITTFPSLLYTVNIIGPTSCVILKKNILVPFNEELNWLVDIDWYFRLLRRKKLVIDENINIASLHGHVNQISTTINIKNTEKKDQFIIQNYFGIFSSVSIALLFRNCLYFLKTILQIKTNPFWKKI